MTKGTDFSAISSAVAVTASKQEQLLHLMNESKLSLIRAARITGIPYEKAKQILFSKGSSRAVARGMSSSTKASPRVLTDTRGHSLFKNKAVETIIKLRQTAVTSRAHPATRNVTSV